MRHELSDYEWSAIKPMLPNKSRGIPRMDDRRIGSAAALRPLGPRRIFRPRSPTAGAPASGPCSTENATASSGLSTRSSNVVGSQPA